MKGKGLSDKDMDDRDPKCTSLAEAVTVRKFDHLGLVNWHLHGGRCSPSD